MIPEKLYGREGEIATLLAAFDRVVMQRRAELVWSPATRYRQVVGRQRAAQGHGAASRHLHFRKFDLRLTHTPHSTLAQAFQGIIQQLLNRPHGRHRPLARCESRKLSAIRAAC